MHAPEPARDHTYPQDAKRFFEIILMSPSPQNDEQRQSSEKDGAVQ
jgi:hypothetical protein